MSSQLVNGDVVFHRARRLARVVASACNSPTDFRSTRDLCAASAVGIAARTLRSWCEAEAIPTHCLVDFARLLRAVRVGEQESDLTCVTSMLDADSRTIHALFSRGGLDEGWTSRPLAIEEFLSTQQYIRHRQFLLEVMSMLGEGPWPAHGH